MSRGLRFPLKLGVPVQQVAQSLRDQGMAASNHTTALGNFNERRNQYLSWHETTEVILSSYADDGAFVDLLLSTDRHGRILMTDDHRVGHRLINRELNRQAQVLKALAADLDARALVATRAPGIITVPDTNVFLEYQRVDSLALPSLVGGAVRLIIPLRVIEELDEWKYRLDRSHRAEAARATLAYLETTAGVSGGPSEVEPSVTLELLTNARDRQRPTDADSEILSDALELETLSGSPVVVLTGDRAMRLRARALSLQAIELDEKYRRRPPTS